MDLTLHRTDAPAPQARVAPPAVGPVPSFATHPRRTPLPPLRLLPRDREEIARREARDRRRRMLLNAAVGIALLMLTAIGIRYETRPGASAGLPSVVVGR
jgi:hypothetical protein